MQEELTKIKSMLLDISKENFEHYKNMENNQKKIMNGFSIYKNKTIAIYILVGIIIGMNLIYHKEFVMEFINPIIDLVKTFFRLGE